MRTFFLSFFCLFFFQAEDGIRDWSVTGVQTCALPIYGQSLLGGLVGSRWAAHQCFGLAELCNVVNAHLLGIVPASLSVIVLAVWVWRTPALDGVLRSQANAAFGLLLLQLVLGLATFRLHLQVQTLTVCHQAVGAALLGTLVCFTVLALRDCSLTEETLKVSANS